MERLFKAKKKTSDEWVEGYLAKAKWYFDEKEMFVILPTDLCIYPHCEFSEWIEVDKNTICQFTGLTDKNGNKIWENDFVSFCCDIYKILWDEDDARFVLEEESVIESFNNIEGKWCEVIGNIFDNPELLQEGGAHD